MFSSPLALASAAHPAPPGRAPLQPARRRRTPPGATTPHQRMVALALALFPGSSVLEHSPVGASAPHQRRSPR